jgi:hypothetical protein
MSASEPRAGALLKGVNRFFPRLKTSRNAAKKPDAGEASTKVLSEQPAIEDLDTTRTQERYEKAVEQLNNAVKVGRNDWKAFQFSDMEKLSERQDTVKLQVEINKVLEARKSSLQNKTNWGKCKGIIELVFSTLSPFVKNVLGVAINIQSVCILSNRIALILDHPFEPVRRPVWWPFALDYGTSPSAPAT